MHVIFWLSVRMPVSHQSKRSNGSGYAYTQEFMVAGKLRWFPILRLGRDSTGLVSADVLGLPNPTPVFSGTNPEKMGPPKNY